eukprot:7598027-Pyramimonas_sp.AAC.1
MQGNGAIRGAERPRGGGRAQGDQRSRRTGENKQKQTKPVNWALRGAERPNGGGRAWATSAADGQAKTNKSKQN